MSRCSCRSRGTNPQTSHTKDTETKGMATRRCSSPLPENLRPTWSPAESEPLTGENEFLGGLLDTRFCAYHEPVTPWIVFIDSFYLFPHCGPNTPFPPQNDLYKESMDYHVCDGLPLAQFLEQTICRSSRMDTSSIALEVLRNLPISLTTNAVLDGSSFSLVLSRQLRVTEDQLLSQSIRGSNNTNARDNISKLDGMVANGGTAVQ